MSIHIPGEFASFVHDLVEGGTYPSADAVVTDALRLLRVAQQQREALKAEIARGIEAGDRGDRRPLKLEEVLAKARRMQAEKRGQDE